MNNNLFHKDLIFLDNDILDSNCFFDFITPILIDKNLIKPTFLSSIKTREENFPTALPLESYSIAIPHTDIEHINNPFIAVMRVKNTAKWHEMANNDSILDVKLIFLLGFIEKDGHIDLLQSLISSFVNDNFISSLLTVSEKDIFLDILNNNVVL